MGALRLAALLALALAGCPEQLPPAQRGIPPDRIPPAEPLSPDRPRRRGDRAQPRPAQQPAPVPTEPQPSPAPAQPQPAPTTPPDGPRR